MHEPAHHAVPYLLYSWSPFILYTLNTAFVNTLGETNPQVNRDLGLVDGAGLPFSYD